MDLLIFNINLNVSLIAVSLSEVFLPAFPFKVKVLLEFANTVNTFIPSTTSCVKSISI